MFWFKVGVWSLYALWAAIVIWVVAADGARRVKDRLLALYDLRQQEREEEERP